MKTILSCGAVLAVLGMAALPLTAQTQTTTSTSTNYIQTSKLIGTKVKASGGEAVGEIKDVVLDQNGCMAYTVVSTGSTGSRLTGSSKTVAVPWSVYTPTSDARVMTVRVQKERIYSAPVFEYSRINEYSTGGYINNVNTYYGVSATNGISTSVGGSVSGGTVSGSTTTTGTTTTATSPAPSATTTPGASATVSPLPTATATAAAGASATVAPSASPSTTPLGTATPPPATNASSSEQTKPKSGMTPVSGHHHNAQPTDTGAKSATGSSKQKTSDASGESSSSSKKHRQSSESSETSASPKSSPDGQ